MSFIKGFSITAVSNFVLIVVALLNNIIITRHIGPEGRGKYTVLINLIMLLTLFLGEGIRRSNTILVGKDNQRIKNLLSTTFLYSGSILLLLLTIFLFKDVWQYFIPNVTNSLFFLSVIIVVLAIVWQAFQALFLGLQNYFEYNLIQLIGTIISFSINLIGIYFFNFQLVEIIFSLFIASLLSCFYGIYLFRNDINFPKLNSLISYKKIGLLSAKSTISAGFIFILLRSNIFIINFFLGAEEAGYYSIAYIFLDMTQKLPNVASPILISKTVSGDNDSSILNTAKLVRVVFLINILIVLFLIFFGEGIIILLFKEQFVNSYYPLIYLLPAILMFGCGAIIYSYYISREYPKFIIITNAIFAISAFSVNIIAIPIYGIIGAASIVSVTFVLWTIALTLFFMNNNKISFSELYLIKKDDFLYLINSVKKII